MKYRSYNNNDISLLGFGLMRLPVLPDNPRLIDFNAASDLIDFAMANGINYYDTAYTYGSSEAFAGKALSDYSRDSYFLATKCPPWMVNNKSDFERIFDEQLRNCNTDYFDFYLVHNFAQELKRADSNDFFFEHFESIGMYEFLQQKKADGKIRHIGFSFHGTPVLLHKIITRYAWDFAQIQLNYIDWTAIDSKKQYELLTEYNIPVIIMEPLRGGALAQLNKEAADTLLQAQPEASLASWGIRFAASLPNVLTVLSGMNAIEQLRDNISVMNSFRPISDNEKILLDEAAVLYAKSAVIPCTGCRYCMPCPAGVNIPGIFSIYNHYRRLNFRIPFDNGYSAFTEGEKASACIQCGKCTEKCPQHLDIPTYMREIDDFARSK